MSGIDWRFAHHLSPGEFPEDPDKNADPRAVHSLERYRRWLGQPVHPSPSPGAMARFDDADEGSRHYAVGRLSDAVDVFPAGSAQLAWILAVSCGEWGAVGIYTDTRYQGQPWPMLHLDKRDPGEGHEHETMLLWHKSRAHGYEYIQYDAAAMDRLLRVLTQL